MTDQQPTFPPPAGGLQHPTPIVRRHWDGNGWTSPTPPTPGMPATQLNAADPRRGRTAG
ncbi:hypothetical protein ACFFGH_28645 [Lysobacter korlensis]|uniref:DUF2510 domain-containing protein n=1 Tax=Lysobacter korlensis TaxID=553636 RepID=A0ABV6RXW1_9GAMM